LGSGLLYAVAAPAIAVFTAYIPLADVLDASQLIFTAQVESIDPSQPALVLTADKVLKGKAPFARIPVLLKGDAEALKAKHIPQLLKRLAPKLPVVVFVNQRDKDYIAFGYTNGSWFQMTGVQTDDGPRWTFTHCEPYLRRTYKGTTAELHQLIVDVLAGKAKAPAVDRREKPGLGPELENGKSANSDKPPGNTALPAVGTGPLFAVIPTVFVGAPLAVLAVLFPAIFGGLTLVVRRWLVGLSVLCLISTLYLAQSCFGDSVLGSRWASPQAYWLLASGVTLVGLLWTWRRHLAESSLYLPGWWEVMSLAAASLGCLIAVFWLPHSLAKLDLWGKTLVMFAVGCWVATLHTVYLRWVAPRRADPKPGLPGEGMLLWGMLAAGVALGATFPSETTQTHPVSEGVDIPYRVAWRFQPSLDRCWIASSPAVDGGRVYIAAAHPGAFRSGGLVYCIDALSGQQIWAFNDSGKMKLVFSSPCVADGKVYIGEGFHQDNDCKLFCLDAHTGDKLWEFATASHTESSPCVTGGKVYFGAGDDGMFCLDAANGKELWHLEHLHVDANPLVVDGRVYCGSGAGDHYNETVLFCLDAATGKEIWRVPTDLPVWGMPSLNKGRLYAPLGNGNFVESADKPGGAVLCLVADTGQRLWRRDVADGVLGRGALDACLFYFGSRDGHCYAVDRADGTVRWKHPMSGPVLASVSLAEGSDGPAGLYIADANGQFSRLEPAEGNVVWSFDIRKDAKEESALIYSSPTIVPPTANSDRRRIYFGCGLDNYRKGILYCLEEEKAAAKPQLSHFLGGASPAFPHE
jgi:outer membrane protein assembly factor BamB